MESVAILKNIRVEVLTHLPVAQLTEKVDGQARGSRERKETGGRQKREGAPEGRGRAADLLRELKRREEERSDRPEGRVRGAEQASNGTRSHECSGESPATKTRRVVVRLGADSNSGVGKGFLSHRNLRQESSAAFGKPVESEAPFAPLGKLWLKAKGEKSASVICSAAASEGGSENVEVAPAESGGLLSKKSLTTGAFFFAWYFLNVIFNILNKKIYNYFPFPYFVSVVHLLVGVAYCLVSWAVGAPKRAPIDKELLLMLVPVSFCHALGHVMTNVSFAAVAVSFTHTIKALEPFFNAAASQFILGQQIPFTLWLSLTPIVFGVSMASMTELSFNWRGFLSAMSANIAFTYRNIYSKKAMTGMDSTNVYAYISILSLLFCIPPAVIIEGPALMKYGVADAIAKVGAMKFWSDLFWVGMFYHLYNQLANNTLERVAPLTHAVGNVLKRVFVIGFSIIVFGNKISTQTGIGTCIAIAGVAVLLSPRASAGRIVEVLLDELDVNRSRSGLSLQWRPVGYLYMNLHKKDFPADPCTSRIWFQAEVPWPCVRLPSIVVSYFILQRATILTAQSTSEFGDTDTYGGA
ncbi:hypothetical protein R1flu_020636 [Riccia fluitans]|uniref:Sugar phosphate transporter domain-containing protein n=1 Tax=Riccia fluitans TaxID=41844 RepID=A0ABD1ZM24_9MARC